MPRAVSIANRMLPVLTCLRTGIEYNMTERHRQVRRSEMKRQITDMARVYGIRIGEAISATYRVSGLTPHASHCSPMAHNVYVQRC